MDKRIFYSKYVSNIKNIRINNENKLDNINSIKLYYNDGKALIKNKSILIDDEEKRKKYSPLFKSPVENIFILNKKRINDEIYEANHILPNYTYITALVYVNGIISLVSYNKNDDIYQEVKAFIKEKKKAIKLERRKIKEKEEDEFFEKLLLYELLD